MSISNETLALKVIEILWSRINDPSLKGLTPYQAAKTLNVGESTVKLVVDIWDGPAIF